MKTPAWIRPAIRILMVALIAALVTASVLLRLDVFVAVGGRDRVVPEESAAQADCILVLGAQVYPDGQPSPMLADRLDAALQLFSAGVSDRILVSGDHRSPYYDEVNAMRAYLLERGVPSESIFMDHAGIDTYDSLYRAQAIYHVSTCVVVTQEFHLLRALYIADCLDLDATGVVATGFQYSWITYRVRELFARGKAFLECRVLHPEPAFLGPEYPISGDGNATVDSPFTDVK